MRNIEANALTETKIRNQVPQTERESQRKHSHLAGLIILATNAPCEHNVCSLQSNIS